MPPPRSDLIFPLTQVLDISWNNFGAADACAALSQVGGLPCDVMLCGGGQRATAFDMECGI